MVSRLIDFCDRDHDGDDAIAVDTINFMVDGLELEIDVCQVHRSDWEEFRLAQQVWREAARPRQANPVVSVRTGTQRPREKRNVDDRKETSAIRAWAIAQKLMTSTRGRVPNEIRLAYKQAQEREAHERWNGASQRAAATAAREADPP